MKWIVVVIPFIVLAAAILILPSIQPQTETIDTVSMELQCNTACESLITDYRNNPSEETIWLSDFCTLNFDTSSDGGRFVDHCYSEDDDVIRRTCALAKLDSTTLLIEEGVCR